jgi:diguanylate cyclase
LTASGARRRRTSSNWLIANVDAVPLPVRAALLAGLYGTLPLYVGGVISTISLAAVLCYRVGTPLFFAWAAFELVLAAVRLQVLLACRRSIARGGEGWPGLFAWLSLLWACAVGLGAFLAVSSGDWLAAMVASVTATAMLGGICFRYFGVPRLAFAMLVGVGLPGVVGCLMSGEPILFLSAVQIPLYVSVMAIAARQLNRMMVGALCAERDQAHRARHDSLTGLLNRSGLAEAVAARPEEEMLACFFIDLDGFKRVNDTLGHQAGDDLLAMVAERLKAAAAEDDILARIGGDEFLVIRRCGSAEAARVRGAEIASAVAGMPYLLEEQGVFIGASVGAALRATRAGGLAALIAAADEALYQAKQSGRATCVVAGDQPHQEASPAPLRVVNG